MAADGTEGPVRYGEMVWRDADGRLRRGTEVVSEDEDSAARAGVFGRLYENWWNAGIVDASEAEFADRYDDGSGVCRPPISGPLPGAEPWTPEEVEDRVAAIAEVAQDPDSRCSWRDREGNFKVGRYSEYVAEVRRSAGLPAYEVVWVDDEVVHEMPPPGSNVTPCCGRTPFELPLADRATVNESLVTCRGRGYEPRVARDPERSDWWNARLAEIRAARETAATAPRSRRDAYLVREDSLSLPAAQWPFRPPLVGPPLSGHESARAFYERAARAERVEMPLLTWYDPEPGPSRWERFLAWMRGES